MITKEQFETIIKSFQYVSDWIDKQHDLGVDLFESDLFFNVGILFDNAIYSNFNEEASDLIMWWMFEDGKEITSDDNETIELKTTDDLWNYLVSCGYAE